MDATPINHQTLGSGAHAPGARADRAQFGQGRVSPLGMKWSALHEAARAVAAIAGVAAEAMNAEQRAFPVAIRDCRDWRRELAEQGIADLSAIMEAGLTALLSALAGGADPRSAALALWHDFVDARDALLLLMPEDDVAL